MRTWQTLSATIIFAVTATAGQAAPNTATSNSAPAASAAPSAAADFATDTPEVALREIGSVRATTPFCKALVAHAGPAVDALLANNARIAQDLGVLRSIDLDSSQIAKARASRDLTARWVALRDAAVAGEAAAKSLNDDAKTATDDQEKADLTSFADSLAGALARQKKLAYDMSHLVVYLDAHDPLTPEQQDDIRVELQAEVSDSAAAHDSRGFENSVPDTLGQIAKTGADELQKKTVPMLSDEREAAARAGRALGGC